jgi:Phosphoenolpyruvate-protein kinase (PTS system EI component in bacteria)
MGLDEFSMSAVSIPKIKKLIRNTNFEEAKKFADTVLQKATAKEIIDLIENYTAEKQIC